MSIFTDHRTDAELTLVEGDFTVNVAKVGGGTLGRRYDGTWLVEVIDFSGEAPDVILSDILTTGMPKTHREAARIALDFTEDEL